jgi:hypothetical protein
MVGRVSQYEGDTLSFRWFQGVLEPLRIVVLVGKE